MVFQEGSAPVGVSGYGPRGSDISMRLLSQRACGFEICRINHKMRGADRRGTDFHAHQVIGNSMRELLFLGLGSLVVANFGDRPYGSSNCGFAAGCG
jgi:hypothetical protein